jgi:hypothetical protein
MPAGVASRYAERGCVMTVSPAGKICYYCLFIKKYALHLPLFTVALADDRANDRTIILSTR